MCAFIFGLSDFVPLVRVSVFLPIPYCFDYYSYVVSFKVRECDDSGFVLFFFSLRIALAI